MNPTVTDLLGCEWAASFQMRSISGTKRLTKNRLGEMDGVLCPEFCALNDDSRGSDTPRGQHYLVLSQNRVLREAKAQARN